MVTRATLNCAERFEAERLQAEDESGQMISSRYEVPYEKQSPSKEDIHTIFEPLSRGDILTFFENVADDVDWIVKGTFFEMAGHYTSKKDLREKMKVLNTVFATPLKLVVKHILRDGSRAAVELKAEDTYCRNGLPFTNEYAWICRFGGENKIVEVRAYMDTLVSE
ncbi:nuclear transport factor 2 family protein [Aspergillus lucknowensis]|uniref:SnoaL-like domain-containing protein n=1 Tax=Aspergillus lucknowensis TaxID=176173 RepID=A0ABR4LHG0_9EURO